MVCMTSTLKVSTNQYALLQDILRAGGDTAWLTASEITLATVNARSPLHTTGTWAAVIGKLLLDVQRVPGTGAIYRLSPLGLEVLGRGEGQQARIDAANVALLAYRRVASDGDPDVSAFNTKSYKAARSALLKAIREAFPGIDALSVYSISVDSGENIGYCAQWVRQYGKFRI